MLESTGPCPVCGASWDKGDVYETLRAMPYYAGRSDDSVKEAAMSYGWYDDLAAYLKQAPWIKPERAAEMPPQDKVRFSRRLSVYDRGRDRTIAYKCPDCHACWDRETLERIG